MRRRRHAFTLIELLVVISIIALLIGILLPVLGKAREHGRQVKCLANARGIFQAGASYAADHKGFLPHGVQVGYNFYNIAAGQAFPDSTHQTGLNNSTINAMGVGGALEKGGYMPGSGGAWICPSAIPEMQAYGNTYQVRTGDQPGTSANPDMDIANVPYEEIEYKARPARAPYAWDNANVPASPAISQALIDANANNPSWAGFRRIVAGAAPFTSFPNYAYPHSNDVLKGIKSLNVSFMDGSAALRGTVTVAPTPGF